MSKKYLTAAGSILTVEARHSAYIRSGLKQVPFAQPFDAPLSYNEVYSLASQFIADCPSTNPKLPVKAFPKLAAAPSDGPLKEGSTVMLQTPVSSSWPRTVSPFVPFPVVPISLKRTHDYSAHNVPFHSSDIPQGYILTAPSGTTQVYAAFIAVTGPTFVKATPVDGGFSVKIPKGFAGQTYVVLTSCNENVSDDTVAAGPAILEVRRDDVATGPMTN